MLNRNQKMIIKGLISAILILYFAQVSMAYQIPDMLSIEDAVTIALEQNPGIQKAKSRIEIEKGIKLKSIMPENPSIGISYEGMPSGTYFDPYTSRKAKIAQQIEFPIKYYYRAKGHSSLLEKAETELEFEKLTIAAEVKDAYYDALLTAEQLILSKQNLELFEDIMEKAGIRKELGESSGIDLMRARLQKERAEIAVQSAEIECKKATEKLLLLLTGREKISVLKIENTVLTDSLYYRSVNSSLLTFTDNTLQEHLRIRMAMHEQNAAGHFLSLAKSIYLPDIDFTYFRERIDGQSGFWGVELGVSIPLWFLWQEKGKIQEARAVRNTAEWNLIHEQNHLRSEYRTALFSLQEIETQVTRFRTGILNEARQIYELASVSYREGETSYIDLLLAQQTMIETRGEYLNLIAEYNKAIVKLELARGKQVE
ncbi:MAG: TolC family protein [bacterium]|nr:TolC family protein [bacterium]